MKKTIIFLLIAIYAISIVVVTFFGMSIRMDQFKIYMDKIEITTYDTIRRDGIKQKNVVFDETFLSEGYVSLFIDYITGPENASNPEKVEFVLVGDTYEEDGETKYYAKIYPTGELVLYKPCNITVTVRTADGSELSDSLYVKSKINY